MTRRKRNRTAWCMNRLGNNISGFSVRIIGNGHTKSVQKETDFTSAIIATLAMNRG